ncbi:hypothetical protein [Paraburkholderia saeva]|uniref:hypothetical protein n=1 Tax=Paraburkholderia saeva TaxID=2777537 RepID=UPI001D8458F1|nr:hypothetical protein [Paraburkholderia saeva]CAG4920222.1 hypothetical protein R70241_04828 [Paraburkholderia saeva]
MILHYSPVERPWRGAKRTNAGIGIARDLFKVCRRFSFHEWRVDLGLDVGYEVDLFGRVSRSVEAARSEADASDADVDAVRASTSWRGQIRGAVPSQL